MTGGQAVSMHRRLLALLASTAVLIAACSGGAATVSPSEAASAAASEAAPSEAAPPRGRRRAGHHRVLRPAHQRAREVADRAGHPGIRSGHTRTSRSSQRSSRTRPQDQDRDRDAVRQPARPVPVLGRRRAGAAGRRRHGPPIDDEIADWKDSMNAGRHEHLPGRREAVRHPVQLRHWSASGTTRTSSLRPGSARHRRPGTSCSTTSASSRTRGSRRSRVGAGTNGPRCSGGHTCPARRRPGRDGSGHHRPATGPDRLRRRPAPSSRS